MRKPPKFQLTYYLQDIVHKERGKKKSRASFFIIIIVMFDFYTETLTCSVSSLTIQYIFVRKVILLLSL